MPPKGSSVSPPQGAAALSGRARGAFARSMPHLYKEMLTVQVLFLGAHHFMRGGFADRSGDSGARHAVLSGGDAIGERLARHLRRPRLQPLLLERRHGRSVGPTRRSPQPRPCGQRPSPAGPTQREPGLGEEGGGPHPLGQPLSLVPSLRRPWALSLPSLSCGEGALAGLQRPPGAHLPARGGGGSEARPEVGAGTRVSAHPAAAAAASSSGFKDRLVLQRGRWRLA